MLRTAVILCLCLSLCGCGSSGGRQDQQENAHKSRQEEEEGYYYYEGIFLSAEDVTEAFRSASDHYPRYPVVPEEFHVTTEFLPAATHENLYGTEVTVHITGYIYGTAKDKTGDPASDNEGFVVELQSEDAEMQELLNSFEKNWHITGSYTIGAKYTEYLDFSEASPVDFTITGTFGKCDSDGVLVLNKP